MTKGVWTGDSKPQDEGFHYYQLWIDGAAVPDPGSLYFYGASRWGSGIEIPAKDQDFYALKNVPHGIARTSLFLQEQQQPCVAVLCTRLPDMIRTPRKRYPVLYLQHGGAKTKPAGPIRERPISIMDNLIAEGKAKPFIIVMDNGDRGVCRNRLAHPVQGERPQRPLASERVGHSISRQFKKTLFDEIIPLIDANYRTLTDQPHRAMAGLSMGGMQTRLITLANPDMFSHIGIFSGGSISMEDVNKSPGFKEKVKLVFVSFGSRELENRRPGGPFGGDPKVNTDSLKAAGINAHFYVSPQTAHEWQTWRRSLHEFAPLLFKD